MTVIESYLQAKYAAGGPDADRFEPVDDEVHASHLSDCQRKRAWKHNRPREPEASPYFELGRVFELLYGAALAYEHDPGVTTETLRERQPWEVAAASDRVVQDVNVEIPAGPADIVGEADWVVLGGSCPTVARRDEVGAFDAVRVEADGSRTLVTGSGEGLQYDPAWVEKVVETKTKGDLDWVRRDGPDEKHVYQVYPYMHALDTGGELAYMQRDDWEEHVVQLEYEEDVWLDCLMRARAHARNQGDPGGEAPPTDPLDTSECRWCGFQSECREVGGSRWSG
jgi:hypothetical protein